jgi:hypothetical protein
MRRVILESPYAGEIDRNLAYARRAMHDSLRRGEAPMLSHLLYTQVLEDNDHEQRALGIDAGLAWGDVSQATVCYVDHGISRGMLFGLQHAIRAGRVVELRLIGPEKG